MLTKNQNLLRFSLVWFLLSIIFAILLSDKSETTHRVLILLTVISYSLCILCWVKAGCRLISIYTFFIAYSFLCNCAQSFLYLLGVPLEFLTSYWNLTVADVSYAFRFQLVCISALNVGACLATINKKDCVSVEKQIINYKSMGKREKTTKDKYLFVLLLFLLVGTIFAGLETARIRMSMSYHDYMYGGYKEVESRFYFIYFYAFLSLRFVFKQIGRAHV